jgi:acyl carrier protein
MSPSFRNHVLATLRTVRPAVEISDTARLEDVLGDSLSWFEFMLGVEAYFGRQLPDALWSTLESVGDVLLLVDADAAATDVPDASAGD